jgi:phospholipase C
MLMSKKKAARIRKGAGLGLAAAGLLGGAVAMNGMPAAHASDAAPATTTPIKHVVVLFDENESFDHYFGTYPKAANTDGTTFTAKAGTPTPNNYTSNPSLLTTNANSAQPFRLSATQEYTTGASHNYTPEQGAMDWNGSKPLMDKFVQTTGAGAPTTCSAVAAAGNAQFCNPAQTMGYYDGNTVTGLWNIAQNFAMSDNSWADNFGPSTVGALNAVAGMTGGAISYQTSHAAGSLVNPETPAPTTDGTHNSGVQGNVSAAGLKVATANGQTQTLAPSSARSPVTRTRPSMTATTAPTVLRA